MSRNRYPVPRPIRTELRNRVPRVFVGLTPTEPEPPAPTQFIQRNEGPNFVGNIDNRMRGNFQ